MMQRLKASANPAKYTKYAVQLLDSFEHSTSLCIVMELMLQDVAQFLEGYSDELEGPHVPLAKRLSRQILDGLSFIHDCGIIHNG